MDSFKVNKYRFKNKTVQGYASIALYCFRRYIIDRKELGDVVHRQIARYIIYCGTCLLGLEALTLIDHYIFGSNNLIPSKREVLTVAIIIAVLTWKDKNRRSNSE